MPEDYPLEMIHLRRLRLGIGRALLGVAAVAGLGAGAGGLAGTAPRRPSGFPGRRARSAASFRPGRCRRPAPSSSTRRTIRSWPRRFRQSSRGSPRSCTASRVGARPSPTTSRCASTWPGASRAASARSRGGRGRRAARVGLDPARRLRTLDRADRARGRPAGRPRDARRLRRRGRLPRPGDRGASGRERGRRRLRGRLDRRGRADARLPRAARGPRVALGGRSRTVGRRERNPARGVGARRGAGRVARRCALAPARRDERRDRRPGPPAGRGAALHGRRARGIAVAPAAARRRSPGAIDAAAPGGASP